MISDVEWDFQDKKLPRVHIKFISKKDEDPMDDVTGLFLLDVNGLVLKTADNRYLIVKN